MNLTCVRWVTGDAVFLKTSFDSILFEELREGWNQMDRLIDSGGVLGGW